MAAGKLFLILDVMESTSVKLNPSYVLNEFTKIQVINIGTKSVYLKLQLMLIMDIIKIVFYVSIHVQYVLTRILVINVLKVML